MQYLRKLINTFHKDHPEQATVTSPPIDTKPPMARPTMVRPTIVSSPPSLPKLPNKSAADHLPAALARTVRELCLSFFTSGFTRSNRFSGIGCGAHRAFEACFPCGAHWAYEACPPWGAHLDYNTFSIKNCLPFRASLRFFHRRRFFSPAFPLGWEVFHRQVVIDLSIFLLNLPLG